MAYRDVYLVYSPSPSPGRHGLKTSDLYYSTLQLRNAFNSDCTCAHMFSENSTEFLKLFSGNKWCAIYLVDNQNHWHYRTRAFLVIIKRQKKNSHSLIYLHTTRRDREDFKQKECEPTTRQPDIINKFFEKMKLMVPYQS